MTPEMPQPTPKKSRLVRRVVFIVSLVALILLGHRGFKLAKKAYAIANPVINILPLPSSHIGGDTVEGISLLNGSAKADHAGLSSHFRPTISKLLWVASALSPRMHSWEKSTSTKIIGSTIYPPRFTRAGIRSSAA